MMRCPSNLAIYRRTMHGDYGDASNGCMRIPTRSMTIVFSNMGGWEHVSVSTDGRCPTWEEMEWVKREFWQDTDTVMQLHVPALAHINYHPFCLHLWRPLQADIPRPPSYMIAPEFAT